MVLLTRQQRYIFYKLLDFVYELKNKRNIKQIPSNVNPLLKISATQLAKRIREKKVKSEDVVRLYVKRLEEVNPMLNAIVEQRYNIAILEAKAVDECICRDRYSIAELENKFPLYGVPMSIKETCAVEGMSFSIGFVYRKGIKAASDGEAVALLRAAGAIFLAVTNTPELCFGWESVNLVTGRTVNPYNVNRTSGGSSGGEGVLLGAGASLIGIGSDIGGSLRIPCHFNGIFGHKPTGGIVSVKGHYPYVENEVFNFLLAIGPMARYAEDLIMLTKVLAGTKVEQLNLNSKVDLQTINIFFTEDFGPSISLLHPSEGIKSAIRTAVSHLNRNCNSQISNVKFPELNDSLEMSSTVFYSYFEDWQGSWGETINGNIKKNIVMELLKKIVGCSDHTLNFLFFQAIRIFNLLLSTSMKKKYIEKFEKFHRKFDDTLGTNGVFICPTFPTPAFRHNGILTKICGIMYCMIFNLMGYPSTHVPIKLDVNGLPVGLQIVSRCNQDRLCLAVAQELEKAFLGWVPPYKNK